MSPCSASTWVWKREHSIQVAWSSLISSGDEKKSHTVDFYTATTNPQLVIMVMVPLKSARDAPFWSY